MGSDTKVSSRSLTITLYPSLSHHLSLSLAFSLSLFLSLSLSRSLSLSLALFLSRARALSLSLLRPLSKVSNSKDRDNRPTREEEVYRSPKERASSQVWTGPP